NEDFHTKLEYYSEEYDEEREIEPRNARIKETTLVLRPGSPQAISLRITQEGISLLTIPTHVNPYPQPDAGLTYGQAPSYFPMLRVVLPPSKGPLPITRMGDTFCHTPPSGNREA
ncbi:hypothetical protein Tco_1158474, partial [Tanacetum coccineum]